MTTLLALIAVCAYLSSAWLNFKQFISGNAKRVATFCAWCGVVLHIAYTFVIIQQNQGFNFSFFSTASLISLIVAVLLLLAMITKPVENLGIFLFPITALMLVLELSFPEKQRPLSIYSWEMSIHILASVIAFSLLNIAAVQAILLVIQNQQLKSHPPKRYILSMPPLQSMESLLFQMIGAGLFFLSISLGSGFVFLEDIFDKHHIHKTFFSISAWLIFSGLLLGRSLYGWRGRSAVKWTLLGFLFLLLAYFGSKLVKEIILHR